MKFLKQYGLILLISIIFMGLQIYYKYIFYDIGICNTGMFSALDCPPPSYFKIKELFGSVIGYIFLILFLVSGLIGKEKLKKVVFSIGIYVLLLLLVEYL